VSGNDPTFDEVVRLEIPVMEGERYSSMALRDARARLQRLGFFEEARSVTPRGEAEGTLDMKVEVVELPTGSFSAQAGFRDWTASPSASPWPRTTSWAWVWA